ncbi:hypothetical protein HPB49_024754 [Dermacentor silvarum]|uniref:Uncharacterized protein n=1 Tax=Dermacentor silvarum TaxID=543639 RepID=A0ACB8D8J1_DERSI|nr:hypothetical protein HPB49_024754 [Dermacentor silvarum]
MNKVREANKTLRQENAALRTTMNNLTREIAEIPSRETHAKHKQDRGKNPEHPETAVEEPAPKKRAVEATRKQTENDRIDNLEAKVEARFPKLEQSITANIAPVTAMKQTMETYQAEKTNRFAYIERTLQPIVSHPTFAHLFGQHPPNQGTPYTPTCINDQYLPTTPAEQHAPYGCLPNAKLDRDIDVEEIRAALHDFSSREAEGALRAAKLQHIKVRIRWFPAYAGDASERSENHNEMAHAAARALTNRVPATDRPSWFEAKDRMTDYNITKAYRLARRTLPPPYLRQSRGEAVLLRQLQTGSLPSPRLMHRMYPETYPTHMCRVCRRETADDTHILWDCIKNPEEAKSRRISPRFEAGAKSYDKDHLLWAVQQVPGALEREGLSEPATASGDPRRETATS